MCCKDTDQRRLHELEKRAQKLAREGKTLPEEEKRELENLRNGCGGQK